MIENLRGSECLFCQSNHALLGGLKELSVLLGVDGSPSQRRQGVLQCAVGLLKGFVLPGEHVDAQAGCKN